MSPLSPEGETISDRRRRPLVHGTTGGYQRCLPDACDECKKAWNTYQREHYGSTKQNREARLSALESLAARHPAEFLTLFEKAQKGSQ